MTDGEEDPTKENRLLEELARANPVPPETLGDGLRGPTRRRILKRVLEDAESEVPAPSAGGRRWRGTALVAATLATVVVVLTVIQPRGNPAQRTLKDLALVATRHPLPTPPLEGYLYVRNETTHRVTGVTNEGSWFALVPTTTETWIAADGSGLVRRTPGVPRFTPVNRERWKASGSPRLTGGPSSKEFGPGQLGRPLQGLPTDPETLMETLSQRARRSQVPAEVELFVLIGDLLRRPLASAQLREALFTTAAMIEGIDLLGSIKDPVGREGVGLAMTTDYAGLRERWVLIFDPRTSALLSEERLLVQETGSPVPIRSTVELAQGKVPSLGALPDQSG